jgi:ADP-ribose pyrophosphatase YjhB (NUDIX family)
MTDFRVVKEATASAAVVPYGVVGEWRVAVIWHERLGGWLAPGGHVEGWETAAEAVLREIAEECGLRGCLISGPAAAVPAGYPHPVLPTPWWVSEAPASPDSHTGARHVHVDHLYVVRVESSEPIGEAETEVRWFTASELTQAEVSADSKAQALAVLAALETGSRVGTGSCFGLHRLGHPPVGRPRSLAPSPSFSRRGWWIDRQW